jgi:hypothetical protein
MPIEHPTDATAINDAGIAVLDNPCQSAIGEGMGDLQGHDRQLVVTRQECFDGGLGPWMVPHTAINQSQEAIACKGAQLTPQPPVVDPHLLAVPTEGAFLRQNWMKSLITR